MPDERYEKLARETADSLHDWMAGQSYQGEPLLHGIVCCDFVSVERFKNGMARKIAQALERVALEAVLSAPHSKGDERWRPKAR